MANQVLPWWAFALMGVGLVAFVAMLVVSVRRHHGIKRSLFASPYVLWMIIFTILPVILIGYYSLTDADGRLTLDNFHNFWDSNYITRQETIRDYGEEFVEILELNQRGTGTVNALVFSLWMAFLCTAICLLLGYPAALFMADRRMKRGATVVILFIVPMWMNLVLRTIAWQALLEDTGVINTVLQSVGLPPAKMIATRGAILLGMVYNFVPFMIFPIYTSLNKMDPKLGEAAADLGCNSWQTLYKVTMPVSLPGVISGITMVFMPSVTTFIIPQKLGGSKFMMFGNVIEEKFMNSGVPNSVNIGSALSLIMMILILISLSILRKADPQGEGGGLI